MTKIKVLTIAVVALIAVNIGLITFVILGSRMHPPRKGEIKNVIIKKLQFDEAQINAYNALIQQHRSDIEKEEALISAMKQSLYSNLKLDNQTGIDSLFEHLGEHQKSIEQIHYNHFIDIKKLCKEEQIQAFDELSAELEDLFSKKPPLRRKE